MPEELSHPRTTTRSSGFASLLMPSLVGSMIEIELASQCRLLEPEGTVVMVQQIRTPFDVVPHRQLHEAAKVALPDAATESMLAGLAGLHSLVLAADSKSRVVWLSDELGITSGGATTSIGKPVSALLDQLWPDDALAFNHQVRHFAEEMSTKDKASGAPFNLRLNGSALSLTVSAFFVRDSAGNKLFICVADRHKTHEALEHKNEELETYVRSVSHDLRSPLVSLLGFSRLLRDDFQEVLDESGLHFLDRIEQAGRHMQQLLHDMLELSRIEETPHCRVLVKPAPILQQLASELKLQLETKSIALSLPKDPPTILCDRTRLYQLLSNLIGNAVQHMPAETSGRIDVEIETAPDGWQISISDNGRGIPLADRDRIFEAFETGGQPSGLGKTSGLGLAIVKKIVESHSGRVWVESNPNAGARFVVWLPKG